MNMNVCNIWVESFNFQDKSLHLRVPLGGPKGNGSLFFHALCDPTCVIQRLELEVDETTALSPEKYRNKRLLVYDFQKHGPRKTIENI